jgi:hypothetical protein
MIKNPYIRHIIYAPIFILMYVLAFFVFPYSYTLRVKVRRLKDVKRGYRFLWFFLNDETDIGERWWMIKNGYNPDPTWIQLFRWNVIRNSHWNFKLTVRPQKGVAKNVNVIKDTTGRGGTMFCNYLIMGMQHCNYTVSGVKFFRYSFTKVFYNRIMWNVQLGTNQKRYIYKSKMKWLKK